MTNKEILHADLLDILFENRNKAYGAYALRKNYNHRLQWALGISLSFVFLLSMFDFSGRKKTQDVYDYKKELTVSIVELPEPQKADPPKSTPQPKAREVAYTSKIKIDPDVMKTDMPDKTEIDESLISTKNVDGVIPNNLVETGHDPGNGNETSETVTKQENPVILSESDAKFPGGKEAFAKFLTKYLITPGELEAGEKKTVLVRFMVDADGTISRTEVLQSDGEDYSREVISVLAKMPKWIPAMQNGTNVATWFTQPVSFIGVE